MKMKRREFLKLMSVTGAASSLPLSLAMQQAHADFPHTGTLVFNVHAGGAWDTSSFCDPKQRADVNNWANNNNSRTAGNLRYAPFADNQSFFNKYFQDMLVINGVDGKTNAHSAGVRHQLTGTLGSGFPTTEGLYSAIEGDGLPLAYMGQGALTETSGGLVRYSRAGAGRIRDVSKPNTRFGNTLFFSPSALDLVRDTHLQRANEKLSEDLLPKIKEKIAELRDSQANANRLNAFGDSLPGSFDTQDLLGNNDYRVQLAHVALHAMSQGVSCSAAVESGGFDTHDDHDNRHEPMMARLTRLIDYIWTKAASYGIENRLVVVVTSDFARTPFYNGGNGKDHWPVGSVVVMKKNVNWTNRVVGITDGTQGAVKINPSTLQADNNGVTIEPKDVHQMLRQIIGINNNPIANQFDLGNSNINFLNPNRSSGFPNLT